MSGDETFVKNLRETMKANKISQAQLGRLLGKTRQTVSLWLNKDPSKRTCMRIGTMVKLSTILRVTPDFLLKNINWKEENEDE